jgi:Mg2+-importing ATPase
VLGIAWRCEAESCASVTVADEASLVFVGFAAFLDPAKADAKESLDGLAALG